MSTTSQLTFIPTGWHNSVKPFQNAIEAVSGFGQVAASTTFNAIPLVTEVNENYENVTEEVSGDNSYSYYKHVFLGNRYKLSTKHAIFDIAFANLCTKWPNYTTPTDNLASSQTLVRSFKQSTGAYTLSEHFMGYQGSRPENVKLALDAESKIALDIDWSIRQIRGPLATLGYTTPNFVNDFSGITAVPLSHLDAGQLSFSYNSNTYVMETFEINWANALLNKAYPGSRLIDTNECFGQKITGAVSIVVGKDLVFEGKFDSASLDFLNMQQKIKSGISQLNLNSVTLQTLEKSQVAGSNEEWRYKVGFSAHDTAFA